ncbi:hypothetical protein [Thermomonospora cellulosilytica]|uniref:Uncharacterized protein n=1 Tax=Thermomonospora cellulosilytica TaxID=1411118 RepID=A0A7W3R8V1_9ACTN|nr:hypothetical protein [Thermomonospora cellulosilytica]MBA9003690.1 hypothetical protein [Thermomonospora cellulosilytica]
MDTLRADIEQAIRKIPFLSLTPRRAADAAMAKVWPALDALAAERDRARDQRDARAEQVRRARAHHRVHRCTPDCPCGGEGDGRVCDHCDMPWPCPTYEALSRDGWQDALDLVTAHREALVALKEARAERETP